MLSVSGRVKIFLCRATTDMRKGFDSLAALVNEVLCEDPLSGHLFVFRSKRGDRLKILYWYTRLEQGTFRFPAIDEHQASVTISAADLAMLLDGVDLASVRRGKRYRRGA
jgi:transposase